MEEIFGNSETSMDLQIFSKFSECSYDVGWRSKFLTLQFQKYWNTPM